MGILQMKYTQCRLVRLSKTKNQEWGLTTFIQSKFAKIGNTLRLEDVEGEWIVQTIGTELDEDKLPDYRKNIRNHRKNTGDSTPKRV